MDLFSLHVWTFGGENEIAVAVGQILPDLLSFHVKKKTCVKSSADFYLSTYHKREAWKKLLYCLYNVFRNVLNCERSSATSDAMYTDINGLMSSIYNFLTLTIDNN